MAEIKSKRPWQEEKAAAEAASNPNVEKGLRDFYVVTAPGGDPVEVDTKGVSFADELMGNYETV